MWPLLSGANTTSPRTEVPLACLPGVAAQAAATAAEGAASTIVFRDPMYFTGGEGLIVGEYKLVTGWQPSGPFGTGSTPSCSNSTVVPGPLPGGWGGGGIAGVNCDCGQGCLYHLPTDPLEAHDLAETEPQILATLQARLAQYRETTYAPSRGALDPAACIANEKAGGYWAPWLSNSSVSSSK